MENDDPNPAVTTEPQPVAPPPLPKSTPPWRWALHLILLAPYPVLMGVSAYLAKDQAQGPLLENNIPFLLLNLSIEMAVFGFIFGAAWIASRVTASKLYFRRESTWKALGLGLLFSVGLRALVALTIITCLGIFALISGDVESQLQQLRPQSETLIDTEALVHSPLYLFVNLTFVSFVVAGFREELWRAGVLAGLFGLFPFLAKSWPGKATAVTFTAVIFGLGHFSQGWGGVILTTVLGVGLGWILVWRKSFWEAMLAHGFFDATTFALLFLLVRFWPQFFTSVTSSGATP